MVRTSPEWPQPPSAAHAVALEVLLHGPLSRSHLARRLGLSAGSLTRLTKPLLDAGLLVEAGRQHVVGVGRPLTPLDIVSGAHHFIGVKLTGEDAYGVLTTLRADVLAAHQARLASHAPAAVVATVRDVAAVLNEHVRVVNGLGVSLGGQAADGNRVSGAPFLGWTEDVHLGKLIEEATGLPVVVDNDLLALTKAEHWFGAGRGLDRFAVVTIGAGVGYGLVVHDRIVDSPDAGVGLIGHFPLDPVGPPCGAGHRGCASAMLTTTGISAWMSAALGRSVGYDECLDLAAAGDVVAARVARGAGLALGRLIAAVTNLTMVPKIILAGEGIRLADVAADAVREGIDRDRDPRASEVSVDVRRFDFTEWARGAAVSAIQAYVGSAGAAGTRRAFERSV
jgi:predicted NBD/HSP70 family sugar kinase